MNEKGFTLADAISLGIILLILALIAIPHVNAGRLKSREAETRTNMHTLQLTAEDFAILANGAYPISLATTVQQACASCTGDVRYIANTLIHPFGTDALLPHNLSNPFIPFANSLVNDAGTGTSGRINYFDFNATGNSATGYSIRGVGVNAGNYLSLVLTSSR